MASQQINLSHCLMRSRGLGFSNRMSICVIPSTALAVKRILRGKTILFCPQTRRIFVHERPQSLFDITKSVTNKRRRGVLRSGPLSLSLIKMLPAGTKKELTRSAVHLDRIRYTSPQGEVTDSMYDGSGTSKLGCWPRIAGYERAK